VAEPLILLEACLEFDFVRAAVVSSGPHWGHLGFGLAPDLVTTVPVSRFALQLKAAAPCVAGLAEAVEAAVDVPSSVVGGSWHH
jgi:hypothetical protein